MIVRRRSIAWAALVALLACAPVAQAATSSHEDSSVVETPVAIENPGFESRDPGRQGAPPGWWKLQHAGPESYVFVLDASNPHGGERSLRISNIGPEPFGTLLQKLDAAPFRGRTLRYSAWIRTDGAKGNRYGAGAGLLLHAMRGGYPVSRVSMRKDAVGGTTDWARYQVTLKVPADAEHIEIGLSLYGAGSAWLDDVELAVVEPRAS